jgi:Uma2 family endonuclease
MMTSRTKLTYEDFLHFPDDGRRHELISGEHYVTPSPNLRHQELIVRLTSALANHLTDHPVGRVYCAPLDCIFTTFDVVEPDLLVVLADQLQILTEKNVQGAPALVIEVLSPGTSRRDQGIKRELYDRGGVREYWIIDPDRNVVTVFRRELDGTLAAVGELSSSRGESLTTPLLPGFSLELTKLFRP